MGIEEQLLRQPEFTQIPDIATLERLPDHAVIFTRHGNLYSLVHFSTELPHSRMSGSWGTRVEGLEFGDELASIIIDDDLPALLIFNPDWMTGDE